MVYISHSCPTRTVPESAVIYPAHGAGSVCGGGMADREFSTIGYERRNNPKFSIKDKQRFIEEKVQETHYYAPYFEKMEKCNVSLCAVFFFGIRFQIYIQ